MAVVPLTSKRMPAMRFQVCHIRTPHAGEAPGLTGPAYASGRTRASPDTWSVFVPEQDRKADAERCVRSFTP
jgi:hypothetical protein